MTDLAEGRGRAGFAFTFDVRATVFLMLAMLQLARLFVAASVPLVPDEAYYALWAHNLSFGYFDHPPMIALFIRAGITIAGDNPLGVRLLGLLGAAAASWFIWQAAERLVDDQRAGPLAALIFNLTPMGFFGMALATPDAPLLLFSSAMVYCAARLVDEDGASGLWIAGGLATGLALQSKYSAALLAAGLVLALLTIPAWRRRLAGPWPWIGLLVACSIFAPNILWNAQHEWATFAKQGGRAAQHWTFAPEYLLELFGAQLGLASPLILVFAFAGLGPACRFLYETPEKRRLLLCLILVPAAYFAFHALRARVEGNWPGFLYPALAITAATALLRAFQSDVVRFRTARTIALPLAALILALGIIQACITPVTLFGEHDPIIRMTRGWPELAAAVDERRREIGAAYVLTDNYQLNAELVRNLPGVTVLQANEPERYGSMAGRSPAGVSGVGLLVGSPDDAGAALGLSFGTPVFVGDLTRRFGDVEIASLATYRVEKK
ncbi:glycosyltransferase family 39 protein [Kaistia dalseonensis]|uniref:4-amino-4-deoxy-L-arabinose transferase-like glycosyltransferase n=1 Tax=Kaistia dalseonensis TaxID=410840 RepID=A0ABU0H0M7_9HYPH|nr:glycosyltransferase family 39 protein [Kaistia dalseonensis]MCX5493307.1 glycosyltransferase family 39 protein [Kaistia dalseonensis]MDQ0435864.1 4-amino-4-deoxy-L-arabinose transferase-like glycosyltransferase [Kaistia dalseonensis]